VKFEILLYKNLILIVVMMSSNARNYS